MWSPKRLVGRDALDNSLHALKRHEASSGVCHCILPVSSIDMQSFCCDLHMPDTSVFPLQLNLSGYKGYHCPTDEEGFLQFAKDLPSPTIYEAIRHAKPVSDISAYRNTGNFRRLFEKAPPPNGLCVIGDAVCCFNPINVSLSTRKSNQQM